MAITTNATAITFSDATVQTTAYVASGSVIPSGTVMIFQQTSAPSGWTKVTTYNDYAIRIVNGTAGTGGSVAFTTAFASKAVTGTNSGGAVSATSLSTAQLASHQHDWGPGNGYCFPGNAIAFESCTPINFNNRTGPSRTASCNVRPSGSGSSHTHGFTQPTFTGTAINLAVQYVDFIIATKN